MSRVNIVKKIKVDGNWKLLSIPRNAKGNYDWNALPDGLYLVEWYAAGKRRRSSAGITAAQALEAQRRKRHELEGRKLGIRGFELAGEAPKAPALHILSFETFADEFASVGTVAASTREPDRSFGFRISPFAHWPRPHHGLRTLQRRPGRF